MSLSNEAKTIFDAPWELDEEEQVRNASGDLVAEGGVSVDDLRRVTHLPELYEALTEAAVKYCPELGSNFDSCDTCSVKKCEVREWVNLLKKVRDGK